MALSDNPDGRPDGDGEVVRNGGSSEKPPSLGDALRGVRDEAVAAGSEIGRAAKDEAIAAADRGKENVAGRLDHVVSAIEASARELRQSESSLADAAESIATRLKATAGHLHSQDPRALAGELGDFARAHPLAFILGSVAAGFAAARVAKAATPTTEQPS